MPLPFYVNFSKEAGAQSREKAKAERRVQQFQSSEKKDWDSFTANTARKSFVQQLGKDPMTDPKLLQYADNMNRLKTGTKVGTVPGEAGKSYEITKLRGSERLGCTCNDWRYKRSVAQPGEEQDCKHIKQYRQMSKTAASDKAPRLTFITGGAGAGKSTMAQKLIDSGEFDVLIGTDTGRVVNGQYVKPPKAEREKIRKNREEHALKMRAEGKRVLVEGFPRGALGYPKLLAQADDVLYLDTPMLTRLFRVGKRSRERGTPMLPDLKMGLTTHFDDLKYRKEIEEKSPNFRSIRTYEDVKKEATVLWGLDPQMSKTAAASFKDTLPNPVIDGKPHSGTWTIVGSGRLSIPKKTSDIDYMVPLDEVKDLSGFQEYADVPGVYWRDSETIDGRPSTIVALPRYAYDKIDASYQQATDRFGKRKLRQLKKTLPKDSFYKDIGVVYTSDAMKKEGGHVEDRIAERAPGAEAEVNTLRAKLRQVQLRKGQTYHVPLSRGKGYVVIGDVGDKHAVKTVLGPNMRPPGERLKLADDAAVLTSELKPHQERVLRKLETSDGVIVAHRVGAGKTLTAIAAAVKSGKPVEVITPASLTPNFEKEMKKHVRGEIDARIRSYEKATKDAKEGKGIDTSRFLIIDEAHRLRNSGTQAAALLRSEAGKAPKRVLLTGTALYNQPSDIAPLANIAAGQTVLPVDQASFDKKFIREVPVDPGFFLGLMGVAPGVKKNLKNSLELERALAGRIDLHDEAPTADFPEQIEERIKVPMTRDQHAVYETVMGKAPLHVRMKIKAGLPPSKQEAKDLNAFVSGGRQASLSPRPYVRSMTDGQESLNTPKIQEASRRLRASLKADPNFRGVVYSNYIDAGIVPYEKALRKHNVPFETLTGSLSAAQKAKLVENYNSGKTKVLLVSSSGTEGLDLKGTKMVQVLEPHWNNSKIDQVIGRGVRFQSHAHLPPEERKVVVQRYYSTLPQSPLAAAIGLNPGKSTEEWIQDRADEKTQLAAQMRAVLLRASNSQVSQ